jgi:predicted nucleic acid-binding Zn ribbon protein
MNESYNVILNQNHSLQNTIKNVKEVYSTDDRKIIYENEGITRFKTMSFYLLIIYYILIVLLITFIMNTKKKVTRNTKIMLILLFIIYPFIIGYIENIIYRIFIYIYTFIRGEAYPILK